MWPAKILNGTDYYEFILLYTNNTLVISENSNQEIRKDLGRYFKLKEKSIGPPKIYIGGSTRQVKLENGVRAWDLVTSQYFNLAVNNVEEYVSKQAGDRWKLPAKYETPLKTLYLPELYVSPDIKPYESAYFNYLIGILHCIFYLGRIYICLEVSMMSSHMAQPQEVQPIHLL